MVLNIHGNIPQTVLNNAGWVVALLSVLMAAFIVAGSYGLGVMTCRSRPHFISHQGAPSMMALEGGSFGLQIG